jgi:hypothetical protein
MGADGECGEMSALGDVLLKAAQLGGPLAILTQRGISWRSKYTRVSGNSFESNTTKFQCGTLLLKFLNYRLKLQQFATLTCFKRPGLTKVMVQDYQLET